MIIKDINPQTIDFDSAHRAANSAQRDAIDNTEGAVLVVAGPGTGKTQIIAARIANIIKQGNLPENILCLTYTDAGTIAMRNRLLSFIGSDAYRINIHTFHAFCNLVIQDNPSYFGFSDMQPVSELEQRAFVKQTLDALPYDNPLAKEKGQLYSDSKGLLGLYAIIKKEDWQIEDIVASIDSHIEDLPNSQTMRYKRKTTNDGITYQVGDIKQAQLDTEIKKFERLKAAVSSFALYQALQLENQRYDFDDMIIWVINAFKSNPGLLCEYQERYQYVLVDEYQDTSGSQNEVVDLLMSYWDDPNLFVVGDDDQSIYRFQGANISNILSFHQRYNPQMVTLTENYRSSQQILTAARLLIEKNSQRLSNKETCPDLDIRKGLRANKPDGEQPEIRIYPNILQESLGIALDIEKLYNEGNDISKIALLYRNNRQVEQILRYLTVKGIPYNARKRENALHAPLIRQLVTILTYIHYEATKPHTEEGMLFTILHYPVFNLAPLQVAELFATNRSEDWSIPRKPMRKVMVQSGISSHFQTASQMIETTIAEISAKTLQELIHDVINNFGLLKNPERTESTIWNLELLNTFFDFVKDECARNPKLRLGQFIEMLAMMDEQKIALPAERIACNQNGVNLITCHSAKGLEFETVYMLGCNEGEWEKKKTQASLKMPPHMMAGLEAAENPLEESRRLFFVAMTRAERKLVVSYADKDNNDKPMAKSCFVAELEQAGMVDARSYHLEPEELESALRAVMQETPSDKESIYQSDFVGEFLKEYNLSASHLNSYLTCPHSFFYTNILRVPKPRNAAMAFGTSVHEALEFLFTAMQKSPDRKFPPKSAFVDLFIKEMNKRQDSFTEVEFERRIAKGKLAMESLYDRHIDSWHKEVILEKTFKVVLDDDIRLNGRVDKLEILHGSSINLVDYKTGTYDGKKLQPPNPAKVEKAEIECKEPKHEDLHGGDYWRQAVFYKIMVEESPESRYHVVSTEFCFVEPDATTGDFINHRVKINPDDEAIVRKQIETVYQRIMNREFDQRCSNKYCEWCRATN
jgi:DNA helicase-2/ATP-dependent DNA helicase PcrA